MSAIDIGCGLGHTAAYLASRGLDATGVDFSPSAIARATAQHQGIPNLRFDVVDVVQPNGFERNFDVLVDRGCLHGIDPTSRGGYVENILKWSRWGARFLVITRTKGEPEADVIREARNLLEPHFTYESFESTDVAGPSSPRPLPALAMRFVRSR